MCISYFAWQHPELQGLLLLTLFNRDEFVARPTAPASFWHDDPDIIGGRDLVAGGTWMCVSKQGRAAFLTNFREMAANTKLGAPSRGDLPVAFVKSSDDPESYLGSLNGNAYPGFNLLVADLARGRMAYLCNRGCREPQPLAAGLHGITNGHLDAHWPKVDHGCRRLKQLIESKAFTPTSAGHNGSAAGNSTTAAGNSREPSAGAVGGSEERSSSSSSRASTCVPWEELFGLLSDDTPLERDPERLPRTGYGAEFEAANSSVFVRPVDTRWGTFATRSQTVLAVWRDGSAELRERFLDDAGAWREVEHTFRLQQSFCAALEEDSAAVAAGPEGVQQQDQQGAGT